jgi:hypothetical protein
MNINNYTHFVLTSDEQKYLNLLFKLTTNKEEPFTFRTIYTAFSKKFDCKNEINYSYFWVKYYFYKKIIPTKALNNINTQAYKTDYHIQEVLDYAKEKFFPAQTFNLYKLKEHMDKKFDLDFSRYNIEKLLFQKNKDKLNFLDQVTFIYENENNQSFNEMNASNVDNENKIVESFSSFDLTDLNSETTTSRMERNFSSLTNPNASVKKE